MSLAPGAKLARYEIRSKIGEGGKGEVYRARDTQLGRDVVVKVLPSTYADDKERLQRFEQEACAASALNHPNILSIYDVGTHEGAPYVVSELPAISSTRVSCFISFISYKRGEGSADER